MTNGLLFLLRLALSACSALALTWLGWRLGGLAWALVAFVFSTPVIGVAIARPLVELTHEGFGWLSAQPLKEWEGNYYEFGGVQVRVLEYDERLWFAADDVIKATGIRAKGATLSEAHAIPGARFPCFTMQGLEQVLGRHRGHESGRFVLWAQREVVAPWERKRRGALVPR
jgi:hypothetical protein